jgi:hypothetical protein
MALKSSDWAEFSVKAEEAANRADDNIYRDAYRKLAESLRLVAEKHKALEVADHAPRP